MSTVVIIPARYASTRLPGKPLLARTGKTLIQHVYEAVRPAKKADRVVVATDDRRIFDAVQSFGGEAVMTSADCRTGTDRLAEAAEKLKLAGGDIVINVQGDEPNMSPEHVDKLIGLLEDSGAPMATLAAPLSAEYAADPAKVKVVADLSGRAMYFSRAAIPFDRDGRGGVGWLLHIGVYGYRVEFLRQYAKLPSTPAEQAEKLEQLRALEHGYAIRLAVVDYSGCGIDTPEDYERFVASCRGK
ncbi:MAG: 3-deoxy-manno-octulosonate cytidylyltransferase [Planctomycetes bacterium]|nr:3-deoxy-manno-octulosonate cytidylyltransferase [Planctomycetota bacterium]